MQLSGPIKEPSKQQPTNSSYQQPMKMYLGRFLKPYFKDKLTGLVRRTNTTDIGLLFTAEQQGAVLVCTFPGPSSQSGGEGKGEQAFRVSGRKETENQTM